PVWRARVQAAHARAAAETGDVGAALRALEAMDPEIYDPQARAEAEFAAARVAALSGRRDEAITRFAALAEDHWLPIQAVSLLNQTSLALQEGDVTPTQAAETLASIAMRWRGDNTELEAASQLGSLYAEAGRYGDALQVLSQARMRQPVSPVARRLASEMDALFRRLYLDDEAARMSPLEALALFNEYAFLTPQGADGDRMVRRVAERLVAVDLLDPAAQLLQHQVDNRSMPAQARARIASDLAVIYLMGRRHEDALRTLRATRVTGLGEGLVTERRLLEARAMAGIGRAEHALELIGDDDSLQARRLRADIAWEQRDWANAARGLEAVLGARWREEAPLDETQSRDVMRAAIAYALAGDSASLERMEERYAAAMATTRHAGGFNLVVSELPGPGDRRLTELVSSLAGRGTMDAFLAGFARRFDSTDEQAPS
ncbi:MAG: endoglucanase, partial [Caulobacterales bacterium]